MRNLFYLAFLSAVISCSENKKQAETSKEEQTSVSTNTVTYGLDELLAVAEQELGKTITVTGYVTHTCKHAGKRCFIEGESQKASIRVEAKGEIGGFNRELVGSKLAIKGVLKERHLSEEYIFEMEKDVNIRVAEENSEENCAAELSNINDMRQWMKDNNKNYFVIYYMDGLSYEELE